MRSVHVLGVYMYEECACIRSVHVLGVYMYEECA